MSWWHKRLWRWKKREKGLLYLKGEMHFRVPGDTKWTPELKCEEYLGYMRKFMYTARYVNIKCGKLEGCLPKIETLDTETRKNE